VLKNLQPVVSVQEKNIWNYLQRSR